MYAVYPTSDLKTCFREVKDATRNELAVITEGGRGRYVFGSEEAYENMINSAAWEEANAELIITGIETAMAQFERGEFIEGLEEGIAYSEKLRLERLEHNHA